ncbi:Universal stress protein family protein [Chitinophaga costaii]|uniref:Universal stress protein family protein n=1 Tax=Chitinophaga costaii TaxID=1335309 RepID=A0A1C4BDU5_9BACT|nr:universal stress protein [Chitinophaga costaii]PUZ27647.1 universal stress protein [Chitinophaga costaii]SCC05045.1 Universal stress protein family protein [Chitinophaga costaii]
MAYTIMMTTDFSASTKNATRYALAFTHQQAAALDLDYVLLHIYSMPATISGEGVALASINDDYAHAERELEIELDWIRQNYPQLKVRSLLVVGNIHEELVSLVGNGKDVIVFMGAAGEYDDLLSWDNEILNSLRNLKAPVLLVPQHMEFKPLRNIGYACNYKNITSRLPFQRLINTVALAGGAQLKVVYVETPVIDDHIEEEKGEAILKAALAPVKPEYFKMQNSHVIDAIAQFVADQQIDLLIMVPRQHGIWNSLFHRSNTKGLARLNKLPILALREL